MIDFNTALPDHRPADGETEDHQKEKTMTPEQILEQAFSHPREPRSPEYKAGLLAGLRRKLEGRAVTNPYKPGTSDADAFWAGIDESHILYRLGGEDA